MRQRNLVESAGLAISLYSPFFFQVVVRPELYRQAGNNPGKVHNEALEMAQLYREVFAANPIASDFPELKTNVGGIEMVPFGTAAGIDKNAEALEPFSNAFGFLTIGTVLPLLREGNEEPNIAVANGDVYNAQSFPSRGSYQVMKNLKRYRKSDAPQKPVVASICALPYLRRESGLNSFAPNRNRVITSRTTAALEYREFKDIENNLEKSLENAYDDTCMLVRVLSPLVDIFEWNIFSPNTATLPLMRKPDVVAEYAKVVAGSGKQSLMKVGPYTDQEYDPNMTLYEAWMKHAHGFTGVNTLRIADPPIPNWKHGAAGKSGTPLQPYRDRFITDARKAFPSAIIFAAGGIDSGSEAYMCFELGADAVTGYTPYTKKGIGLLRKEMKYVSRQLHKDGYSGLQDFVRAARETNSF